MFWPLGSQHLPFDRAQTSGLVFRKLFLTDCKRRGVDLEAKLGLSGRERDFLLRCFVFKLRTESERNEARGRKRAFVKNRSNYTLPAPSATQAESTPKIKYTLHLGTILVTRTHSTRIKCGLWDFIVGSWVFCFFLLHSKVAANQTDGGTFNCRQECGFILNSKCVTLTLRACMNVTRQWRCHLFKRFSGPVKCYKNKYFLLQLLCQVFR